MSVGLVVEIIGDATKLGTSLDQAGGKVGGFGAGIAGTALKVAGLVGVAAVAVNVVSDLTNAAAEDAAEQARLEAAITAAGAATASSTAQVEAAIAAGQERAFTDSQTREALMSLVTATGDVTAATGLLTAAQDIARFANVDLATAADAVAKAQAGQDGPLRKLLPGLEKGTSATDTLAAATAAAAGQADTFAKSAAGLQARGGDAFAELGETIGSVFLPVLEEVVPTLIPIIQQLGELIKALLPVLIPLLKVAAGALGLVAKGLGIVVGWLTDLVKWVTSAIGAVGRFLDSINPLKDVKMPSLPFLSSSSASAGTTGVSTRAGSGAVAPAAPTINVYTTGDGIEAEQAIVRALRRVTRLNGGVVPAIGWAGR